MGLIRWGWVIMGCMVLIQLLLVAWVEYQSRKKPQEAKEGSS